MKIKEIVTRSMVVATPATTIKEACKLMKDFDIGFLPVMINNTYVGVITDRDIIIRAIANNIKLSSPIKDYITNFISTVNIEADLIDALKIMSMEKVKRLMVEEDKKIVGLISLSDILDVRNDNEVLELISKIFSKEDISLSEIRIPEENLDNLEL